jgi:hypothetical protein
MEKNSQQGGNKQGEEISYDFADFEKRLDESRQQFSKEISQAVICREPQAAEATPKTAVPDTNSQSAKKEPAPAPAESGLLASLAVEAKQRMDARQSVGQDKLDSDCRVHDALQRTLKFLVPFVKHVNNVEPEINRIYRLDARTVFANLKWEGALVDARKHGLSDASQLAHVAFSVNLRAPEPVMIKRPWDQFDALKMELQHLRLRTLEDLEVIHKKPKQEWLEAQLDSALPLQITFRGNYEHGKIDVLTRNLADFGQAAFRLEAGDISTALLDELGLFLLGRSSMPPVLLRAAGH